MEKEEEIRAIEEEISRTPYNKATQKHIGMLKAKLARLKIEERKRGKTGSGPGFSVKKSGDATVLLVGFPSVGKSTLINKITNAESKIAEYDFTTLDVIPGILEYNGAKIQILDVPGIVEEASSGKGRGKEILSVVRNSDLILIMLAFDKIDIMKQLETIKKELYNAGLRLDDKKPDVKIYKKSKGGIKVSSTKKLTHVTNETIYSVLKEFSIYNAEILIREDITLDRLIDSLAKNRIYVPSVIIVNKSDMISNEQKNKIKGYILISALDGKNLETVKKSIWEKLKFIRIYMKRIGKEPDMETPFIVKKNSTIKDVCLKIHQDFVKNFSHARIWGNSAKFPGQRKGLGHTLLDSDILEIHSS